MAIRASPEFIYNNYSDIPLNRYMSELQTRTPGNTGFTTLGPLHSNRNIGRVLCELGR